MTTPQTTQDAGELPAFLKRELKPMANVDQGSADKAAVTATTKSGGPAMTNGAQDPSKPAAQTAAEGAKPAPEAAGPIQREAKAKPAREKHTLRSGTPSQRAAEEAAAAKKAAAEAAKDKKAAKPVKQEAKPAAKPEAKPAAKQAAKPAAKAAPVKGKAAAPVKRASSTAEKDAYGFKKGSLKSLAAAMYADKKGATLTEVKRELNSSQLNVLVELENKGCKVKKVREKGKGKRPITRYFLTGMPKKAA